MESVLRTDETDMRIGKFTVRGTRNSEFSDNAEYWLGVN